MCACPCVVIVPLLQEGIGEVTYGLIFADYLAVHGGGKPFLVIEVSIPLCPPLAPPVGGGQYVCMPLCSNHPPPTGGVRGGHFELNFADYLAVHGGGKPFLVTFPFTAPYSKVPDCVQ